MKSIEYLKWLRGAIFLPLGTSGNIVVEPNGVFRKNPTLSPSNSQLFRWLDEGAIEINGKTPKPNDEVELPITNLVFFPKSIKVWRDSKGEIQTGGRRSTFHNIAKEDLTIQKAIERFLMNEQRNN